MRNDGPQAAEVMELGMSTSDIYFVFTKSSRWHSTYENGYGSAMALWSTLMQLYGINPPDIFSKEGAERLWELARNPTVPRHLRLAHAFTFDQAYCPVANLMEMADALDQTHADILRHGPYEWSHFANFASALRSISNKHDWRLVGAAVSCSSVTDAWSGWRPEFRAAWNCFSYEDEKGQETPK